MMKSVFSILVCIFILMGICSCLKKDRTKTPANTLETGTWKLMQIATDDNHNRMLDANEITNVPSDDMEILLFNKDGSGQQTVTTAGKQTIYDYSWQVYGSQSLQLNRIGHDTTIYSILTLTNSTLTLMDSASIGVDSNVLSWYFYKNQ